MTSNNRDAGDRNRIYWMDNLRTFMIFLVIVFHAGLVYESSGIPAFFWIVDDPSTNHLSGILNLIIDIFAMASIFFISGFFATLSLRRRGGWDFLKWKFKRLMIPWAMAGLTLLPLYKVIFLYSRGLPQQSWTSYFHWSNGIWGQNWLWFLPVLFLFNVLFLSLSKLNALVPFHTLKKAIVVAFLIGLIYSLCMDIFEGQGWTKTLLIDFQNERLLIYFMAFLIGSLFFKMRAPNSKLKSKTLLVFVSCAVWIPITLYLLFVIHSLVKPGAYLISEIADTFLTQSSILFSLICILWLAVNTFSSYLDRQGKVGKELARNSYSVYIIHVIVIGGVALVLLDTPLPSVLKHLILVVLTFIVSNLIVSLTRRAAVKIIRKNRSNNTHSRIRSTGDVLKVSI